MLAGYYKANICIYPDSIRLMKLLVNLYQVGTSGQWLRRLVCLSIYRSDHKMPELAVTQCGVVLSLAYSFHVTFMAGELFSHSSLLNHSKQICNPENQTMSFHIMSGSIWIKTIISFLRTFALQIFWKSVTHQLFSMMENLNYIISWTPCTHHFNYICCCCGWFSSSIE